MKHFQAYDSISSFDSRWQQSGKDHHFSLMIFRTFFLIATSLLKFVVQAEICYGRAAAKKM